MGGGIELAESVASEISIDLDPILMDLTSQFGRRKVVTLVALLIHPASALASVPAQAEASAPAEFELFELPLTHELAMDALHARAASATGVTAPGSYAPGTSTVVPLAIGVEGDMPLALASTPDGRTVTVACRESDSLEFFDAATGVRRGKTNVGEFPVDVEITPDGALALVCCLESNTLDVVDIPSRRIVASIAMPAAAPYRVQITRNGALAVVGMIGTGAIGRAAVVDLATRTIASDWAVPNQSPIGYYVAPWAGVAGMLYADFDLSACGTQVLFPDFYGNQVRAFRVPTGRALGAATTGALSPCRIDLSESGSAGVVSLMDRIAIFGSGAIGSFDLFALSPTIWPTAGSVFASSVRLLPGDTEAIVGTLGGIEFIDLSSGARTSIAAGHALGSIELTHDGLSAVTSYFSTDVIDLASRSIVGSVEANFLQALVTSPVARRAFGLRYTVDEKLYSLSTEGSAARDLFSVPAGVPEELDAPYAVASTDDGRRAVVTCPVSENLVVVDLEQHTLIGTLPTRGPSHTVAVSPVAELAVVLQEEDDSVALVDVGHVQTISELSVGRMPRDVRITRDGRRGLVRCSDSTGDSLAVIDLETTGGAYLADITVPGPFRSALAIDPNGASAALMSLGPGEVALIDVPARRVAARLPTAIFPSYGAYTPDGGLLVLNSADPVATVVTIAGANSSAQIVPLPARALTVSTDEAGDYAYFFTIRFTGTYYRSALAVLELASLQVVADITLPTAPFAAGTLIYFEAVRFGDQLVVASTHARSMWRILLRGPNSRLLERRDFAAASNDFAIARGTRQALVPLSFEGDGLELIEFSGSGVGEVKR